MCSTLVKIAAGNELYLFYQMRRTLKDIFIVVVDDVLLMCMCAA